MKVVLLSLESLGFFFFSLPPPPLRSYSTFSFTQPCYLCIVVGPVVKVSLMTITPDSAALCADSSRPQGNLL